MPSIFRSSLLLLLFGALLLPCCTTQRRGAAPRIKATSPAPSPQGTYDIRDFTEHNAPASLFKNVWPKPAVFTQAHGDTLRAALAIADAMIIDPLFRTILLELSDSNEIDWVSKRLKSIPLPTAIHLPPLCLVSLPAGD